MQYVVIARWLEGEEWQTRERGFNDLEAAEMWANEMYKGEEVCVCIYEMIRCMN